MLSIKVNNQSKVRVKNEKAKTISSDYLQNCTKNRYRKKAISDSIIHTHLHGCGSGQVQQAIYALQTALCINTKTLVPQTMSTQEEFLAIKYAAGILHTKDIIEHVNSQLDKGIWSDVFLEILDCDPKGWGCISTLFEKYLKEIGVLIPTIEEAARELVEHHVLLIASGTVMPCVQFKKLLEEIDNYDYYSKTKDYLGDNLGIHQMYGWYYEDYCTVDQINQGILEASKVWVTTYAKKH